MSESHCQISTPTKGWPKVNGSTDMNRRKNASALIQGAPRGIERGAASNPLGRSFWLASMKQSTNAARFFARLQALVLRRAQDEHDDPDQPAKEEDGAHNSSSAVGSFEAFPPESHAN